MSKLRALWPAWFPYPSSWFRAWGLAIPTFAGVAVFSLEVWRFFILFLIGTAEQAEGMSFFLWMAVGALVASLALYLVFVGLYSLLLRLLWAKPPQWSHFRNWKMVLYGFIVTTLAILASAITFASFLKAIPVGDSVVATIQRRNGLDEEQVIERLFGVWFVVAAYCYQAELLVRQRFNKKRSPARC